MRKTLATLCTIVALSIPTSAGAWAGLGSCIEVRNKTVTVQRGDTLIGIARAQYDGNSLVYHDIARLNGISDPNRIEVGQVLKLPYKTEEHQRLVSIVNDFTTNGYCTPDDYHARK